MEDCFRAEEIYKISGFTASSRDCFAQFCPLVCEREKKEVDVARSINPLSIIALGGQIHSCSLTCLHNELSTMTGNNTAICLQVAGRKRNTHATVKHDLSQH